MTTFSFDLVSDYDKAELNNVFGQASREITGRYDFKNTPAALEWLSADKEGFKITGGSEWQIDSIIDIIRKKLSARNQSQKVLNLTQDMITSNLKVTKDIPFVKGLDSQKAKALSGIIRQSYPKIKTLIQGDTLRVTSSSKDELQKVIGLLKSQDLDYPISFVNYR